MPEYRAPGVYVEEEKGKPIVIGVSTSIAGFMGVALKGPINDPQLITSFEEFVRIYGTYDPDRSDLAYAVEGFFANGGLLCYVNRVAHYADITDASSITSQASSNTIESEGGQPSSAVLTLADGPYQIGNGSTFAYEVDGVGPNKEITFTSSRAVVTGTVDIDTTPYNVPADVDLILNINGWGQRTITFTSGPYNVAAAAGLINVVSGVRAYNDGSGHLVLETTFGGTGASIQIMTGSDAALLAGLGLVLGTTSGGGDVANDTAITAAEVVALIEVADPGAAEVAGAGLTITSPTTGITSQIKVPAGTSSPDVWAEFGVTSDQTVNGSADAAEDTLKISASSEGLWGDDLSAVIADDPQMTSQGAGNDVYSDITAGDLSVELKHAVGVRAGSVLKFDEGTDTEYREVTEVARVVDGAAIKHVVTLKSAMVNSFTAAGATVESTEFSVTVYEDGNSVPLEVWDNLSMLDTSDRFVEAILNDSIYGSRYIEAEDLDASVGLGADKPLAGTYALSGGTSESVGITVTDYIGDEGSHLGFHAFDDKDDLSLLAVPGITDAVVHQAGMSYCEARQFTFYVAGAPSGLSRSQVSDYRQITGAFDTSYAALYWPRIQISDPVGIGRDPRRYVDPVGHITGVYARVDNQPPPNGGVWETPAGEGVYGRLEGVLGLEYPTSENDQTVLNPIGVNVLRALRNKGVVIYGGRTLSSDPNWIYISVRRTFIFAERSIAVAVSPEVFRTNDQRLWDRLTESIDTFLKSLWRDGGLRGDSTDEAYFIAIDGNTTTQADIDAGRVIGRVGMAAQKPGEFLIFRFSQFDGIQEVS